MTRSAAEHQALARALLAETEPDELEFFGEYVKAVGHKGQRGRLGPEWGIPELASAGPAVVAIGLYLFELLKSWVADVPKKTVEGFLVDGAKERLKTWLGDPKKAELSGIVTAKGKAEIMAIVGRLVVEAKLSPRDAQRLTKKVATRLFGDDTGKK
ncbi:MULTISPECIES: hypothetical protein [unclassified Bradyrhizobium]|uniref:hypothetical protein n=1 Tax=unclassified Bradyrhizobium TaxID=2631580 RepID=UPI0023053E4D|nr:MULTISPECIES: hypothetical protein [unclassified Bradyrhizobium]MDA9405274.1 hypothetical protein [Bradyrhizobium sp. CCBAU 45384]MDA9440930.1 hypothetical protein [Bradyrhizobium sp. CCBAU 51745]